MSQDRGVDIDHSVGVSFVLLGRLHVFVDGVEIPLPPGQLRWLLAVLLLHEGQVVSDRHLLAHAWDGNETVSQAALRTAVSRLRVWLAGVHTTLTYVSGGYRLHAPDASIDAQRFHAARTESGGLDETSRFTLLDGWLTAWHDDPLTDAPDSVLADPAIPMLIRARRDCVLDFSSLGRRIAKPDAAVVHVERLCAEAPHDEAVHSEYLLLLAACGRPALALLHYDEVRKRLRDDLGASPSDDLQSIYRALLSLDDAAATPAVSHGLVPAQLPLDNPRFAGRWEHLDRLGSILAEVGESTAVCAIFGTPGVGKTALAVHWAHRVRGDFPDGQLYINLRGFDPNGMVHPAEAVRGFLDALGVSSHHIPAGIDAQIGLYRSMLADRRILVLLDNARDVEQVRPLLPGGRSCLVIVTSRNQLTGLIAVEGAHPITLDLLSGTESRELLRRRLGARAIDAEPDAVEAIIARCARLPVALAIVAARAVITGQPLAALADGLNAGLDELAGADPSTNTRAIFSWSYHGLSSSAACLFRQLSLHPGPSISVDATASLAGLPVAAARTLLAELVHASLITELAGRRYALHDLLRAYGLELAGTFDPPDARRAALGRVLDHYRHSVRNADNRFYQPDDVLPLSPAAHNVTVVEFDRATDARQWFLDEDAVLLGAVSAASDAGFDLYCWQIAWSMFNYLDAHARWHDMIRGEEIASPAAARSAGHYEVIATKRGLSRAYNRLGRLDDALEQLTIALQLAEDAHDRNALGDGHLSLAWLSEQRGEPHRALEHAHLSLENYRAGGSEIGEGRALNTVGWRHAQDGDLELGLSYCQQALELQRRVGPLRSFANTSDSLGYIYHRLGRREESVACYRQTIQLYQEIDNPYSEASVMMHLADAQATFDPDAAAVTRRNAQTILNDLDARALSA